MRELRDFLRSEWPSSNALALARFCEAVDARKIIVKAVSDERDTGMHFARDDLEWRLRSDLAEDFADKVDVLASSISGHQYLVARFSQIEGYKCLSLTRALDVVKCQLALA